MDGELQDTLTGIRPDITPTEESEDETATPCTTRVIYKTFWGRLTHPRHPRQCKYEAVWRCKAPCCGDLWYTCNKHLGNGIWWECVRCRNPLGLSMRYKATDLPWRKIRR